MFDLLYCYANLLNNITDVFARLYHSDAQEIAYLGCGSDSVHKWQPRGRETREYREKGAPESSTCTELLLRLNAGRMTPLLRFVTLSYPAPPSSLP
jgi:hypothetical protein